MQQCPLAQGIWRVTLGDGNVNEIDSPQGPHERAAIGRKVPVDGGTRQQISHAALLQFTAENVDWPGDWSVLGAVGRLWR